MLTLIFFVMFSFQDLPYKAKEDFEIKLDFQFKQRPAQSHTAIHFDETQKEHERRTSTDMLPYLTINVKVLKASTDEVKVKVSNNLDKSTITKKVSQGTTVPIVFGFTDDVKDRVSPHEYFVTFISSDKKPLSRIRIFVEEDGTFFVNDEKRGKL